MCQIKIEASIHTKKKTSICPMSFLSINREYKFLDWAENCLPRILLPKIEAKNRKISIFLPFLGITCYL